MFARASARGPGDDRPAVVMVHGLGLSGRYMMPVARSMSHDCRVFLPDLPGFGDSSKPRDVLGVRELADCLAGWLRAAGVAPAILLANSFGCQIAIDLAARHPGLASALILQGPTTAPAERSWLRQFRRWRQNAPFNRPSMGAYGDYRKAGYLRVLRTFSASLSDRPEDKLDRIEAPALIIRGEFDPICRPEWAEQVARGLPHGRIVELPHVAHTLCWDAPAEVALVSLDFIREVRRSR